jgi:hypothetical protein
MIWSGSMLAMLWCKQFWLCGVRRKEVGRRSQSVSQSVRLLLGLRYSGSMTAFCAPPTKIKKDMPRVLCLELVLPRRSSLKLILLF